VIQILASQGAQSISLLLLLLKVCFVVLMDIDSEIFAEGFRDKIFDTEIITTLGCALSNNSWWFRDSAFDFFTAAIAQGVLYHFCVICIPKYLQMVFGTRYLALRYSLHLVVH